MKERIKTIVLGANGSGWKRVVSNTALYGVLRIKDDFRLPSVFNKNPILQKIANHLVPGYSALSYVNDWLEAFLAEPALDVEYCNICNLVDYHKHKEAIADYPLVIILHSAAGDDMSLLLKTVHWFQRRRGKLIVFIGNEYDLMAEKIDFLKSSGADYVCSQLPFGTAKWLYEECHNTRVLAMPHALNQALYYPDPQVKGSIDIGFIGSFYPFFVGDMERTKIIQFFNEQGKKMGLACEIRSGNISRDKWANVLRACHGTIGAEAGSYFLDKRGQIITNAKTYLKKHKDASFEEIFEHFFQSPDVEYVSGKAISSRHFEPIGTKTCQILIEGHYNGILKPNKHYISVKKDLSNINSAIQLFKDEDYRKAMVNQTYEYIMEEHTYQHRVKTLLKAIGN